MEPAPAFTQSPSFVSVAQKKGNIGDAFGVSQWPPLVKGCSQHHWYTNGRLPPRQRRARGTQRGLSLSQGITSDGDHPPCALSQLHALREERRAQKQYVCKETAPHDQHANKSRGKWPLSGIKIFLIFLLDIHASVLGHICSKPDLHKLPFGMFAEPSTCKCAWARPGRVWWELCTHFLATLKRKR